MLLFEACLSRHNAVFRHQVPTFSVNMSLRRSRSGAPAAESLNCFAEISPHSLDSVINAGIYPCRLAARPRAEARVKVALLLRTMLRAAQCRAGSRPHESQDDGKRCPVSCRLALRRGISRLDLRANVQWRRDCDRLPAGTSDIRLGFRGPGGLLCFAQGEDLSSCGARHAVP